MAVPLPVTARKGSTAVCLRAPLCRRQNIGALLRRLSLHSLRSYLLLLSNRGFKLRTVFAPSREFICARGLMNICGRVDKQPMAQFIGRFHPRLFRGHCTATHDCESHDDCTKHVSSNFDHGSPPLLGHFAIDSCSLLRSEGSKFLIPDKRYPVSAPISAAHGKAIRKADSNSFSVIGAPNGSKSTECYPLRIQQRLKNSMPSRLQ